MKRPKLNPERVAKVARIIEVDWEDSSGQHSWHSDEEFSDSNIRTVGYLLSDDKRGILVTESVELQKGAMYGCTTSIPRSAIRKVRYLRGKSK